MSTSKTGVKGPLLLLLLDLCNESPLMRNMKTSVNCDLRHGLIHLLPNVNLTLDPDHGWSFAYAELSWLGYSLWIENDRR